MVDVSGHGFGHAAQVAPVLAALRTRLPGVRLTLRTHLPDMAVRSLFGADVARMAAPADLGLHMMGPMDVDVERSTRAYADLHGNWDQAVEREMSVLTALAPDLLLADVPYSSLAAAARLRLPAVAFCSLNWADLYQAYCGTRPEAGRIADEARAAYASARVFLQPTPHMPMTDLANRRSIPPLARIGTARGPRLREALGAAPGDRLVLVSLGGIPGFRPVEGLPTLPGVRWIFGDLDQPRRVDVVPLARLGMSFIDALASADAVITKTGYGMFAEAACNGTRVLFARRPDWPEAPWLEHWIETTGCADGISREELEKGRIAGPLRRLLERPPAPRIEPLGAEVVTAEVLSTLRQAR